MDGPTTMDWYATAEAMISDALRGRELTDLRIGYRLALEFSSAGTLYLGSPFRLTPPAQPTTQLAPSQVQELAPLLALLFRRLERVSVVAPGTLTATFTDGWEVQVDPGQFEAWEYSGPNHALIVCLPGGDLSVWLPREEPRPSGEAPL